MAKVAIEIAQADPVKCEKCTTNDATHLVLEIVEVGIGNMKAMNPKVLCATCKEAEFA